METGCAVETGFGVGVGLGINGTAGLPVGGVTGIRTGGAVFDGVGFGVGVGPGVGDGPGVGSGVCVILVGRGFTEVGTGAIWIIIFAGWGVGVSIPTLDMRCPFMKEGLGKNPQYARSTNIAGVMMKTRVNPSMNIR